VSETPRLHCKAILLAKNDNPEGNVPLSSEEKPFDTWKDQMIRIREDAVFNSQCNL